jgi:Tol biopolymer transport system component
MARKAIEASERSASRTEERGKLLIRPPHPAVSRTTGRRVRTAVLAILAMLVLAVPVADAATADSTYGYLTAFGTTYDDDGDGNPDLVWDSGQGDAIALDPSNNGNIIVAENTRALLKIYAPDATVGGTPLTTVDLGSQNIIPTNIAVDPTNGDLYVVNFLAQFLGGSAIAKFESDGAVTPTYTLDPTYSVPTSLFTNLSGGIAVDPTTHDVVVTDPPAHQVFRFSPSGSLLLRFNGADTALGIFSNPIAAAIGPDGTVFVADDGAGGNVGARVERFDATGTSLGSVPLAIGGVPRGVDVDQQSGRIMIEEEKAGARFVEGFTTSGGLQFSTHVVPTATGGTVMGVATDGTTDRIYVATSTSEVLTFVPDQTRPDVDAPQVSQVEPTGAHVSAKVAPGGESTSARIEYCPASAKCTQFPASASLDPADRDYDPVSDPNSGQYNPNAANPWVRLPAHPGLAGSGEVVVEDDITGLLPNKAYRVRAYAGNAQADQTSPVVTFTTAVALPIVETGPASDITESHAMLVGTVDAQGATTTYRFEYGLTTDYGSQSPASGDGVAGAERQLVAFHRTVSGLQQGTTYHYRLVAHNAAGDAFGADRTLTTPGVGQGPPARGYEQVSPPDKRGAAVNGLIGYQASPAGSAIVIPASSASSDGESAPQIPRFMSRRGPDGWLDWEPIDPPMGLARGLINQTVMAISEDFQHALVVTNRALTPGATESAANVYVSDLKTGSYTLVASSTRASAFLVYAGLNQANKFIAGAPDFSWVTLVSQVPLLPGVARTAMYKWTKSDGLTLESRLPSANAVPTGDVWQQNTSVGSTREVSDDGNTIYFAIVSGEQGVYRRVNGQSTAISVSHMGGPTTPQPGRLDGISRDGRYAFFHSEQLTNDAQAGPTNLYRYDSDSGSLQFIGSLDSWAPSEDGTTKVLSVAPDGDSVVFRSGGQTLIWVDGVGTRTVSTQGVTGVWSSPNGRYLAFFESDPSSGRPVAHLYDVAADRNVCLSCSPDGTAPTADDGLGEGQRWMSNRLPQAVTDDGLVVFDTTTRLVGSDRNGARDVYTYRKGVTTLISPGDSNYDARFADMSADGKDIYFVTGQSLVGQDTDGALDVYDARVGGGFASQNPPPPAVSCAKTECAEPGAGPVGGERLGSGSQPGEPAARRTRVSIGRVSASGRALRIVFRASKAGRVRVAGARVRTTVRTVSKAGRYTVVVPLNRKARKLWRAHRRLRLSVRVTLSGSGGSASTKHTLTLGK